DGRALTTFERLVAAQGGDPRVVREPNLLPQAPVVVDLPSPASGYVAGIDPLELGLVAVALGAGRTKADQKVDPAVGLELLRHRGEAVEKGEGIVRLHLRDEADAAKVEARVLSAFAIEKEPPAPTPLVIERITA